MFSKPRVLAKNQTYQHGAEFSEGFVCFVQCCESHKPCGGIRVGEEGCKMKETETGEWSRLLFNVTPSLIGKARTNQVTCEEVWVLLRNNSEGMKEEAPDANVQQGIKSTDKNKVIYG